MSAISAIVAVSQNGTIGHRGALPWHMPSDLKRFRETTMGHPVIMGRKTFESIVKKIGKPLPGRTNVVVTSGPSISISKSGGVSCNSLQIALTVAQHAEGADEIFIIGGASVYRQMLPLTNRLYMTFIMKSICGDTRFPTISWTDWREVEDRSIPAGKHNDADQYNSSFRVHERV